MIMMMTIWRVEEQMKLIMDFEKSNRFRLNVQ